MAVALGPWPSPIVSPRRPSFSYATSAASPAMSRRFTDFMTTSLWPAAQDALRDRRVGGRSKNWSPKCSFMT